MSNYTNQMKLGIVDNNRYTGSLPDSPDYISEDDHNSGAFGGMGSLPIDDQFKYEEKEGDYGMNQRSEYDDEIQYSED